MAIIGVQTGGLSRLYGTDGAYRAIREAGFDAVDVNLDELFNPRQVWEKTPVPAFDAEGEECLRYFRPWKDAAEKYGLINYQAHAPFPSCLAEGGDFNEYIMQALEKTIAGCAYIGCRRLIVHPFFHGYENAMDPQEEWDRNIAGYSRLIPFAREHGVILCLENMFSSHRGKIYSACCSDFSLACKYVDALNDIAGEKRFGFCLDLGHALLLGKDIRQTVAQLGSRIEAFHIHDNNGIDDQHIAPYMGILDWDRFAQGLKDIGYKGALSFETFGAINVFDPALAPEVLRLIAKTGRLLAEKAGMP